MTSAQAPSRIYIPQAFASAGDNITNIEIAASNNLNFADGFPAVYEAPSANNGKFVTRKEMNAIGNLASANEFARACGGVVTFDPRLAVKIGGYPRGAVLEMLDGITYNRVISLVDDNMVDFTGLIQNSTGGSSNYSTGVAYAKGTYIKNTVSGVETYYVVIIAITAAENTSFSAISGKITSLNGVISGSVDGVNWAYLGNGQIDDGSLIAEIGTFSLKDSNTSQVTWQNIKTFCATRDGFITATGTYVLEPKEGIEIAANIQFGIVAMEADTASAISGTSPDAPGSSTAASNKAILAYNGTIGNLDHTYNVGTVRMQKGKYYSVWMGGALCAIKDSTLKVIITQ